jgi:hypothetical protein
MITINRKSFWYTILAFPQDYVSFEPKNLCAFFWRTVVKVLSLLFLCGLLGWVLGIFCAALLIYTVNTILMTIAAVGFVLLVWHIDDIRDKLREKRGEEPGVLRSYIKAYKEKHCPLIEFEGQPQ